jgi:hypothetical protein
LAAYLEAQRIDERRAVELLWQLAQAGEWRHVAELLADSPVLVAAWKANSPVVKKCWEQVARLGGLSILDAYRSVIERPESRQDEQVRVISQLLIDFGHRDQALRLQSHLVEHGPRTTDPLDVFWKSLEQARIQLLRGELDAAVASLREHEHVCRRWQETMKTEPMQMADNYNLQAIIALKRGDLAEALRKAKEAERIAREFIVTFCDSLGGTGIKVVPQGEGPEGRKLVRGLAEGFDSTGRAKQALYISLIFQAELHNSRNELVAAIEFLSEAEQISRELADHDGLQRVLALRTAIRCQWPPL